MSDENRFMYAEALLAAFGGTREACWALAAELVAEGAEPEGVFLGLMIDTPLEERHRQAHRH